jgi:decaprenyl-phosphate phosphoribosyltransferase
VTPGDPRLRVLAGPDAGAVTAGGPVPAADTAETEDVAGRSGVVAGLVRTARPLQWSKNLLVFVAPAAAGVLGHAGDLGKAAEAFGVFCAAASAVYLVNDTFDAEADRRHPAKRHRPVASGQVPAVAAVGAGTVLGVGSLAAAWVVAGWDLLGVVALYLAVSVAYSLWLKREPVVELAAVASGFVLRAVAGGVATHVPLSSWFLVVTSFGALFIAAGKRTAEHQALGGARGDHRQVLAEYTPTFLRALLVMTATVTVAAYCLWAFGRDGLLARGHHQVWIELTVAPVTIGMLHVLRLLDAGKGGAPEELAVHDRLLQVLGVAWVACMAIGIYA